MRTDTRREWRDAPSASPPAFPPYSTRRAGKRAQSASASRRPRIAALGALLVLTGFSWLGESPDTDARVFQAGDRAVALGRLAECMSWSDRPVDVEVVPESGEVALIDLPAIKVLGKTPKAAGLLLVQRYREKLSDRKAPPLQVALVRGEAEYEDVRVFYYMSLRAIIDHECPTIPGAPEPDPPHYQAPPPGVPGILDDLA